MERIRPLTRRKKADGQLYERLPHVTDQINQCSSLTLPELLIRARTTPLYPETLAYFIRSYREQSSVYKLLFAILISNHVFSPLSAGFRGFDPDKIKDLRQDVMLSLSEDLAAPNSRGDFSEIRFGRYLKCKIINARRRATKGNKSTFTLPLERLTNLIGSRANRRLEADKITAIVRKALDLLPPSERELLIERHVHGRRIGADDWRSDAEPTLAQSRQKSGRTIRSQLRAAEAKMRTQIDKIRGGK
jgi:hypothetical protein